MSRNTTLLAASVAAIALVALSTTPEAAGQVLSYEFQNNTSVGGSGEILTTAPAMPNGMGGSTVYDKSVSLLGSGDVDVLVIRFSAQADVHNGSALLMNATVNGNLVEPLAGQTANGGDGPFLQTGWWTLLHPPTGVSGTCGDGGGGTADCHDNTISFAGCYVLRPNDSKRAADVQINLADLPGGNINFAFYERASIEIDALSTKGNENKSSICVGVGTERH